MKKSFILLITLLILSLILISCDKKDEKSKSDSTQSQKKEETVINNKKETEDEETEDTSSESMTAEQTTAQTTTKDATTTAQTTTKASTTKKTEQTTASSTTAKSNEPYSPADYAFVKKFEAPVGNYRQIVKDYMLKMANIEWTPKETFSVTWKNQGDFGVNLTYKAGTKYRGLIYSQSGSDFYQFEQFVQNGKWTYTGSNYYEEIVGNHCSHSMRLSFQQIINFPFNCAMKPVSSSHGMLKFPTDLKKPDGDSWISSTLFNLNGKEKIFDAYANLHTGDILYKNISGSGHTRLVSKVDVKNQIIYTIEQTNQFESVKNKNFVKNNGYDTTWWIDHKYSFSDLYSTNFMPVTLTIYSSGEKSKDAYLCLDKAITPQTVKTSLSSNLISNFPINFVRMTVKDKSGNIVSDKLLKFICNAYYTEYKIGLQQYYSEIFGKLSSGNYTFTLTAGIARGSCEICSFAFTK